MEVALEHRVAPDFADARLAAFDLDLQEEAAAVVGRGEEELVGGDENRAGEAGGIAARAPQGAAVEPQGDDLGIFAADDQDPPQAADLDQQRRGVVGAFAVDRGPLDLAGFLSKATMPLPAAPPASTTRRSSTWSGEAA